MRENLNGLISTDFTELKQFEEYINSRENCFVGWVDSFNNDLGTINVQPAIQNKIITQDYSIQYQNKPFLINCWVVANTLNRNPQKGDKCLVMVLDEKSNNFFKAQYDSSLPLQQQTNVNTSKARKSTSNCVAVIINPNFVNGGSGSVKWGDIGGDIKNQTDLYNSLTKLQEDISAIQDDYVTLDTEQTIPGKKTFTDTTIFSVNADIGTKPAVIIGSETGAHLGFDNNEMQAYGSDGTSTAWLGLNKTGGNIGFAANAYGMQLVPKGHLSPVVTNNLDLGTSLSKWKNLYLAGNLSDGTNNVTIKNIKQTVPVSVGSSTASLSSYWFPVWKQTKALGNYNEISYLLSIGTAYNSATNKSLRGLMSFQIRQNASTDSIEVLLELYSGNLIGSYFKLYQNEDGLLELWVNASAQYIGFAGEVLSIYGLGDTEHYNTDPFGKWYNQNFTEVQTPTGTDITSKVVTNNSGIVKLLSPVRIWDIPNGIYKLPASCKVYYQGATSENSYTFNSTSYLIVTNLSTTHKQYIVFGGAQGNGTVTYFSSGYVTETTGTLIHNKMNRVLVNAVDSYTISGSSTYTGNNKIKTTYIDITTPSTTQYKFLDFVDKNNSRIGLVGALQQSDGNYGMYMQAGNFGSMGIIGTSTSNVRAYAPTPSANDNSNSIATTAWVKSLATPNLTDTTAHTQTGNAVVVESYLSSDKKTWYRKWSDGWKECGTIGTVRQNTALALPIAFSNTNYISVGSVYNADYQNAIRIQISSTNEIKVTTGVQGQNYYESTVRIYCCGY